MKIRFQLTTISLVVLQSLATYGSEVSFTEVRSEVDPVVGDVIVTKKMPQQPLPSGIVEKRAGLRSAPDVEKKVARDLDNPQGVPSNIEKEVKSVVSERVQRDIAEPSVSYSEVRTELELAGDDVRFLRESSRQLESYRNAEKPIDPATALKGNKPIASALIGRQVVLSNVEFEGNTVVSDDALRDVAKPFIGRPIGLSDLEELRLALTRTYTEAGYLNSGAELPDQKVVDGNIVFNVVEGELAGINIDGEGRLKEDYISERVLKGAAKPFNSLALQKNFQLLLNDPLIERMDAQLMALPTLGESELNLRVTRARPYDFVVVGSNHGAPSLGEQQFSIASVIRNIAGLGDHLSIITGGNGNKFNLTTAYEVPLSSKETRVSVQFTTADSSVIEEPLDELDIESDTIGAEVAITRTLSKRVGREVTAGTALSVRENRNRLQNQPFDFSLGDENGRSRASVFKFWRESVTRSSKDVLAARATMNVGVDLFDATAHDDGRPDGQFVSLQGQLQYSRRFQGNGGNLLLRAEGQISSSKLLSLERIALGGASSVRGYRENELVRDEALFLSAEYRYTFLRSTNYGTFQVAPFFDFGRGRNDGFFKDEQSLVSTGVGLLWNLRSKIFGELYYGAQLTDVEDRRDDGNLQEHGVHLKLSFEY